MDTQTHMLKHTDILTKVILGNQASCGWCMPGLISMGNNYCKNTFATIIDTESKLVLSNWKENQKIKKKNQNQN